MEIGLITLNDQGYNNISEADLIKTIVEKAKSLGADGVLILTRQTTSDGGTFVGDTYIQDQTRIYQAVAFVYK